MSWRSVTETTEGGGYSVAADKLVNQLDAQLKSLETFLAETKDLAATDSNLAKMRADVEAIYNDAQETLNHIGQQDLDAVGGFYAVGALSGVSGGLRLTIDHVNPREGRGSVANFYRSAETPNSEGALAIEDPVERANYIEERREGWANSDLLQGRSDEIYAMNAFAEASLEARKAEIDPSYTPDPSRSLGAIAGLSEGGRKMMIMNVYGEEDGVASDPVDYEAIVIYKNMELMRFTGVQKNVGEAMTPEMQTRVQEINMNVVARALDGEYGNTIALQRRTSRKVHIDDVAPRDAMGLIAETSGVTSNPIHRSYGTHDVMGLVVDDFKLPNERHRSDFLYGNFSQEREFFAERLDNISGLVEASGGERISIEDLYTALGKDPAGPNFDLPIPRVYAAMQRDIGEIEERMSMLESVVSNPAGVNFQDTLSESETSIESIFLDLKHYMSSHNYEKGLDAQTYEGLYEDGNFDQRVEALLGVPMGVSETMTYDGSPLLQALDINFQVFHPPKADAQDVLGMRDGTSQLGAVLSERGGVVIMDEHSQVEPVQFMYDSLPEISSHGTTKILIENAAGFNAPQSGAILVDLSKSRNPIKNFYETEDPTHLEALKNHLTHKLEQTAERRPLTEDEQAQLNELQARDALEHKLIEDAYTDYGMKVEFFGGGQEGRLAEEFGPYARMVTTNMGWDEKIRAASEGVDNVIILAGGAHFVEGVLSADMGQMGLDESLGYPTFSFGNSGSILRGAGDYNLVPSEGGRWVPTGDPAAVPENVPTAPGVPLEPVHDALISPQQP